MNYAEIFEVFVVAGRVTVCVPALPLTSRLRLAPGDIAVGIELIFLWSEICDSVCCRELLFWGSIAGYLRVVPGAGRLISCGCCEWKPPAAPLWKD